MASPYLYAFLPRAFPTAPVLPPEEEVATVSGLRVQAGDSHPPPHPRAPQTLVVGLLVVWRETSPPSARTRQKGRALSPNGPGTWGREWWGAAPGPPPSFIVISSLCNPGCSASLHLLFPLLFGQVILPLSLACPFPFWAPWSHRRGPGVFQPSRLNGEAGGFGSAFTDPAG